MASGKTAATLYLHVGTHKTGTTAIQDFCADNRETLERHGYYYPIFPRKIGNILPCRNGAFLSFVKYGPEGGFASEEDEAIWRECMDDVIQHFSQCPNAILTDEDIWNHPVFDDLGMWNNLRAESEAHGFQVKIVVYLRRQDQILFSYWAQKVKMATSECGKLPFEEVLAHAGDWFALDYAKRLGEIASVFGKERILLRVYERDRFKGGSVVPDFLETVGLDASLAAAPSGGDPNPSLSGNALEIKRIINTVPDVRHETLLLARQVALACSEQEKRLGKRTMYSPEQRDALLAKYEESNRSVARDYLGSADEPLFHAPEELPPRWEPNNPEMYESIVRFFYMALQQVHADALRAQQRKRSLPRRILGRLKRALRRK